MPCLLAILVLAFPRIAIILLYLLTNFFRGVYDTILIPLLGFIFMPVTLVAYTWLTKYRLPGGCVLSGCDDCCCGDRSRLFRRQPPHAAGVETKNRWVARRTRNPPVGRTFTRSALSAKFLEPNGIAGGFDYPGSPTFRSGQSYL